MVNFYKKAETGEGLWQVIGIILAVIAIAALTYLIVRISTPFFSRQEYDATKNNFDELTDKIKEMVKNKKSPVVERYFPYFIDKGYSVVGFSKGSYSMDHFTVERVPLVNVVNENKIYKPSLCYDNSCLCLYKTIYFEKEKRDEGVLFCKSFKEDIIFYSKNINKVYGEHIKDNKPTIHGAKIEDLPLKDLNLKDDGKSIYGYSFIYGIIDLTFLGIKVDAIEEWNVQNLYLEKYEKDNKIYFYIAIEDEETQERYKNLNK